MDLSQFLSDLINFIIFLLIFIGVVVAAAIAGYVFLLRFLAKKNLEKKLAGNAAYTLLVIKVPKNNNRKENSAEAMFNGLHSLFKSKVFFPFLKDDDKTLSWEILGAGANIHFCLHAPKHLSKMIVGQIYAQYPESEIMEVPDYTTLPESSQFAFAGAELKLKYKSQNSLKTYSSFETSPYLVLSGAFSGIEQGSDEVWIQILTRPVNLTELSKFFLNLKSMFTKGQIADPKNMDVLFQTKIRVLVKSTVQSQADFRAKAVLSTFKQFENPHLQSLKSSKITHSQVFYNLFKARAFENFGYLLNAEELASLFHLPYTESGVAGVVKTTAKKAEPPSNLPREGLFPQNEISLFAETNFRGERIKFGLKRVDRRRHLYVVGKTGMGKSRMLELLMLEDIRAGKGFGLIDPHGDLCEAVLAHIPKERIKDVVYFNPADRDYPMAFNLFESSYQSEERQQIVHGFIGIFKKIFTVDFNPRLEHMIRYITLALLDSPGSTILGINRLLTDTNYRQKIIANITDPVVKSFWANEFASYNERYANEAIVPILNKMGQFVSNEIIRNCVGQTQNAIDFRRIMDEGKILMINLSRGKLGEENSDLLGSMIITKIQQAAMSRANIPEEDRVDFCLYVDEFQNFATSAFANIFTEARKYRLNLTVAHQYLSQLPEEVKSTVFGNVGSLLTFRIGAEDAAFLSAEFAPVFLPEDIISLGMRDIYLKISVDGQTSTAFSAHTLDCPNPPEANNFREILDSSRSQYARPRISVENEIARWRSPEGLDMSSGKKFPEPIL